MFVYSWCATSVLGSQVFGQAVRDGPMSCRRKCLSEQNNTKSESLSSYYQSPIASSIKQASDKILVFVVSWLWVIHILRYQQEMESSQMSTIVYVWDNYQI